MMVKKMKAFDKDLKYEDVMFLTGNEKARDTIQIISNNALETYLPQYLYYYNENIKVSFQQPDQFLDGKVVEKKVFFILNICEMAPFLYYNLFDLEQTELAKEIEKLKNYINTLIDKAIEKSELVIVAEFEFQSIGRQPLGITDINVVLGQLNQYILEKSISCGTVYVLPLNNYVNEYGRHTFYDLRKKYLLASPYSNFGYNCIAYHLLYEIYLIYKKEKKCLVVDCDNVLWKGSLGEEGIEGIQLSNQFVGRAYLDFQREIIKLYYQGMIVCLCSKNDLEDVKNVLDNHPDMLLRNKYITAYKVNYRNKADNIRELEVELNISVDDMVFIDDSSYEIALVSHELPTISTICLDAGKPYLYADILRNSNFFYKKKITETDRVRNCDYKHSMKRQKMFADATNLEGFHKALQTRTQIEKMDEFTLTRVLEISKRTNQFNLADTRYTEQYLRGLLNNEKKEVLVLRAIDILGDMGIVAAAELSYGEETLTISAMFLSCRVFGRGFEMQLLEEIEKRALSQGCYTIYGVYKKTSKNHKFKDFYNQHNIVKISKEKIEE